MVTENDGLYFLFVGHLLYDIISRNDIRFSVKTGSLGQIWSIAKSRQQSI